MTKLNRKKDIQNKVVHLKPTLDEIKNLERVFGNFYSAFNFNSTCEDMVLNFRSISQANRFKFLNALLPNKFHKTIESDSAFKHLNKGSCMALIEKFELTGSCTTTFTELRPMDVKAFALGNIKNFITNIKPYDFSNPYFDTISGQQFLTLSVENQVKFVNLINVLVYCWLYENNNGIFEITSPTLFPKLVQFSSVFKKVS